MTVDQVDHDFDAAWAEQRAQAPRVRILGEVYALPASVPAKLILFAAKHKRTGDTTRDMQPDEVLDMLGSLLGDSTLATLLDRGITLDQLGDVLRYCMSRYRNWDGVQGDSPEAQAPTPGAAPITLSA